MSLSTYTRPSWTWTEIQVQGPDQPKFQRLQCSPTGKLLMKKELVGKSFVVSQEDIARDWSEEPTLAESREADSLIQVRIGPRHYTAAYRLPNGAPQLPPEFANTHIAIKVDFSCYFVPKSPTERGPWHPQIPNPRSENKTEINHETSKPTEEDTKKSNVPNESVPSHAQAPASHVAPKNATDELKEPEEPKTESQAAKPRASNGDARTDASRSNQPNSGNYGNSGDYGNYGNFQKLPNYPILEELEKLISHYLVCTSAQRTVLALWILHTYAYYATPVTPYLNIYSPMEESGKSTCMTILRALSANPWWAGGSSPAFFKRKLISEETTVLLDNWHTLFRASDKHSMSGFLLNGCDLVPEVCARAEREQNHSVEHCRYSPKAFAGMESLPPALARRSIPIVLQRRLPQEKVKSSLWIMYPPATEKLIAAMKAWAEDNRDVITKYHDSYQTQAIPGLAPHQQESFKVLFAVAAAMGGDWLLKAYEALREVFDDYNEGQVSPTQLLSDIRDAFARRGNQERIFTAELLEDLHDLDDRTYHEWGKRGDPMNTHALSAILRKHFGIYSRSQRRGEKKLRGYYLFDFIEAWDHYLTAPAEACHAERKTCHSEVSVAKPKKTAPLHSWQNEDAVVSAPQAARVKSTESTTSTKSTPSTAAPEPEATEGQPQESRQKKTTSKPVKSRFVSMSHSKAATEKARPKATSRLRNFAAKTLRIFTAIWS